MAVPETHEGLKGPRARSSTTSCAGRAAGLPGPRFDFVAALLVGGLHVRIQPGREPTLSHMFPRHTIGKRRHCTQGSPGLQGFTNEVTVHRRLGCRTGSL
jgi:hypothetical protein